MTHDQAFEFDRRDPFASRLDEVFGTVYELDKAIFIDDGYITGAQPALGKLLTRLAICIVGAGNPGTTHLQLAKGFTVPRDFLPCFHIHHAEIDTRQHGSLLGFDIELLFKRKIFLVAAQVAERR